MPRKPSRRLTFCYAAGYHIETYPDLATYGFQQTGKPNTASRSKPRKPRSAHGDRIHGTELAEVIVDGGESAKSLNRPGMVRLLAMVDAGGVKVVIVAKLDRLTRSVKDLCELLERFDGAACPWYRSPSPWIPVPQPGGWS